MIATQSQLDVPVLGEARHASPLRAKGRQFAEPSLGVHDQVREA